MILSQRVSWRWVCWKESPYRWWVTLPWAIRLNSNCATIESHSVPVKRNEFVSKLLHPDFREPSQSRPTCPPTEQLENSQTQSECKTVALIGNPNTGKSTLFNALSGLRVRTGNYPGVTVEKKVSRARWNDREIDLVDLPGTYSLSPRSLDERVSVDVLLGEQAGISNVDAVVCIVDASNLERNLYLVSQVLDTGLPAVLVLNMTDQATAKGIQVAAKGLSERMGIPVIESVAHKKQNLDQIREAILNAVELPKRIPESLFPDEFHEQAGAIRESVRKLKNRDLPDYLARRFLLDREGQIEGELCDGSPEGQELHKKLEESREKLAEANCRVPAIEARVRYAWARKTLEGMVTRSEVTRSSGSDRLDRFLTHRVWGLAVFTALMFVVFQTIYTWAGPLMDQIDEGQGKLQDAVVWMMQPGMLRSLIVDGIIAGVGGVLIFLPQICLLFLFLAILEDCGYMSRAAFLMDKIMTRFGLSGKSFVPLLSSFACAIPGVMATRVIENRRDRMLTILVAPLMELFRSIASLSAFDSGVRPGAVPVWRKHRAARARAVCDVLPGSVHRDPGGLDSQKMVLPGGDSSFCDGTARL